jgi:hypothetical protein
MIDFLIVVAIILVKGFISIYMLWIHYLAVMNLKRCRDAGQLTGFVRYPAYLALASGLLWDLFVNVFICTFMFLELPKETTVTSRLKRHINSEGWRSTEAAWICQNLLNRFDPSGNHCK